MKEMKKGSYESLVAKLRPLGFSPLAIMFGRDIPGGLELTFNFADDIPREEAETMIAHIKKTLFEAYVREQFEAALAEDLARRTQRHRDN